MTDFATAQGALLTPMTPLEMEDGFACGSLNINRLNWLFQELFAAKTAYVSCDGTPLNPTEALVSCAHLDAAIAAIPADKYLQGLHAYNQTTNVLTLLMSDGTTVSVDMTDMVNDSVTTALANVLPADGSETVVLGSGAITVSGTGTGAAPYVVGLDIPALVSALCANTAFQDCIASLTGSQPSAPVAPSGSPFTDTGVEGTALSLTRGTFGGTAPIVLTASGIPAGVTFADNGDGSFTLTGTWPAVGSYSYDVTGTNTAGSFTVVGNTLVSTVAAALAWGGTLISSVLDERISGSGLDGPGNATDARIYVGDLSLAVSGLSGPGMVNGGCDTGLIGGHAVVTDACVSPGPMRATTVVGGTPLQMRISQISGYPVTAGTAIGGSYALGSWVSYASSPIFAAVVNPVPSSGLDSERSAEILIEVDMGSGTVLSASVTLITHSAAADWVAP